MSDVINMDDYRVDMEEYYFCLAMCVSCTHRWFASVTNEVSLFRLECPRCGAQNSFAIPLPEYYSRAIIERMSEGESE